MPDIGIFEQKRIASILSAYDDLIENNRRRIALLEEAARLLYREWFVHFRFPGHEHVKIVDGVPEGWSKAVSQNLGHESPLTTFSSYGKVSMERQGQIMEQLFKIDGKVDTKMEGPSFLHRI